MSDYQELRQRVPESLWPVFDVERSGWEIIIETLPGAGSIDVVLLQYRGLDEYRLGISFVGKYGIRPFLLWHMGSDYGFYDSVEEAITEMQKLFPAVEAQA